MMRITTFVMHLRPEEAHAVIETLDQLRDLLMQSYGDDIKAMLQEATSSASYDADEDEPF